MYRPEKRENVTEIYAMLASMILVTFLPIYVIHTLFFELGLKVEQEPIKYILYLTEFIFCH